MLDWTLTDLLRCADLGALGEHAQHPVWHSRTNQRVHWAPDCRTTVFDPAAATTLAELSTYPDRGTLAGWCDHCSEHARPLLEQLGPFDVGLAMWLDETRDWLDNTVPARATDRHSVLNGLATFLRLRDHTSPVMAAAAAQVSALAENAVRDGRALGLDRRALWHRATVGVERLRIHGSGPDPTDRFADLGVDPDDLDMCTRYQDWVRSSQRDDVCPFELAALDALVERLTRTRVWVTNSLDTLRCAHAEWLLTAEHLTVTGGGFVALVPRVLLPPVTEWAGRWLGRDHGYTPEEVISARDLGLTGRDVAAGISALRAAAT